MATKKIGINLQQEILEKILWEKGHKGFEKPSPSEITKILKEQEVEIEVDLQKEILEILTDKEGELSVSIDEIEECLRKKGIEFSEDEVLGTIAVSSDSENPSDRLVVFREMGITKDKDNRTMITVHAIRKLESWKRKK